MKKLFGIFAIAALIGFSACNDAKGPSQEEFDKVSKTLVEKEAIIAEMETKTAEMTTQLEECAVLKAELEALTAKKPATTKAKPAPAPAPKPAATPAKETRGDVKGGTTTEAPAGGRRDMKKGN